MGVGGVRGTCARDVRSHVSLTFCRHLDRASSLSMLADPGSIDPHYRCMQALLTLTALEPYESKAAAAAEVQQQVRMLVYSLSMDLYICLAFLMRRASACTPAPLSTSADGPAPCPAATGLVCRLSFPPRSIDPPPHRRPHSCMLAPPPAGVLHTIR